MKRKPLIQKPPAAKPVALPPGVLAKDLVRPRYQDTDKVATTLGDYGQLTFHNTPGFGWVIATLAIAKSRRREFVDRTYGVIVSNGKPCRVGAGPHVADTVTVFIRESRIAALQRYIDLYASGMQESESIRDRISTRRAQGVMHRAAGRTSWNW